MDNLFFLYKLTLLNYMTEEIYEDNPLFETYLINYVNINKTILSSNDCIFKTITFLTFELDMLFDGIPGKDILKFVKKFHNKDRLRSEVKKLSLNIFKHFKS